MDQTRGEASYPGKWGKDSALAWCPYNSNRDRVVLKIATASTTYLQTAIKSIHFRISPQFPFQTSQPVPLSTFSPFPEHILPHFPRASLRQLPHNLHIAGHHEPTDPALGAFRPRDHALPANLVPLPGFSGDESLGTFTPMRV